jgi:hypothetical protein
MLNLITFLNKRFMSFVKYMISFFLFYFVPGFPGNAQTWILPKDELGWSILSPSSDSRIIYVSNSAGDDATAQYYTVNEVGVNPHIPAKEVKAYKTLSTAFKGLRNGYPDWILLKRGDIFNDEEIKLNTIGSGKSPGERMVMAWYGETGERPVLKNASLISYKNVRNDYWAFVGLNFYHSKSDPGSPDYISSGDGTEALSFLAGGSYILIEDCMLKFYSLTVQGFDGPFYKLEVRRIILTDQYKKTSCEGTRVSSAFISNVHDYLIEENVTDYSGWNENFLPGSGRNMYNHGWYLQYSCSGELYFRGNIMCRASANAVQNRSGGAVEYNLSIQCPVGIFVAHDTSHGPAANPGMTCSKNNVVLEGIWMGDCPASSNANWGMPLGSNLEPGTVVEGNIVAHNIDKRGSVQAMQKVSQCNYINNIVYDWRASEDMWDENWPDPERSIGSYNESIGGEAATEAFIDTLRKRQVNEWPVELSAYAVIDYIRKGFNMDSIGNKINYDYSTSTPELQLNREFGPVTVYPNPSKDITFISFLMPEDGRITVKLYDNLGREVKTLLDKFHYGGKHSISLNAREMKSGVYILKMEVANKALVTRKLIVRDLY